MRGFVSGSIVRCLRILSVVLVFALPASAQSLTSPAGTLGRSSVAFAASDSGAALWQTSSGWVATFNASPDHDVVENGVAVLSKYVLVLSRSGAADVSIDLAKPAPVGGVITVDVNAQLLALPAGTYTAVAKAVGPKGESASAASAPFVLGPVAPPRAPGIPTVKR